MCWIQYWAHGAGGAGLESDDAGEKLPMLAIVLLS